MMNLGRLMASTSGSRVARQAGMSTIEFAIVSPLAFLVVLGIIQLGLMFAAKHVVNEAAFVAARTGAVENARKDLMREALIKALIPFYQSTLDTAPTARIFKASWYAHRDLTALLPGPLNNLNIEILNPSTDAFLDFGLTNANNETLIPNDSLGYRDYVNNHGPRTGMSIQDANVLKIRVTYAYKLKVPLMKGVFKSVMCGFDSGVDAFGRGGRLPIASLSDCLHYYDRGRVPIAAYATVQMQSPALQQP